MAIAAHAKEVEEMKTQRETIKGERDTIRERVEYLSDEMRKVKDSNQNFRTESNRLTDGLTSYKKKYEMALSEKFERDDTIIKLKQEISKQKLEIVTTQEEKEAVECEFVSDFYNNYRQTE